MKPKSYFPILITIVLLALIGMQIVWLFFVYQYKAQELKDKTREAVLETTKRLQKEEDSKLIIKNIDSLLVTDNIIGSGTKSDIRVIVSKIKDKLKFDTLGSSGDQVEQKIQIIDDSTSSTTIIKTGDNKNKKVIVRSESFVNGKIKKKAGDLEALFLKMAVLSNSDFHKVVSEIDFEHVKKLLREELKKEGILIEPEVIISSKLKGTSVKHFFPGMATKGAHPDTNEYVTNESFVSIPLFPEDIMHGDVALEVGFMSATDYVIRKMAWLLSLSLLITILIGFVMIYLFRRMLSEERLHGMKNDFINNMTHELKTPIATISLAIDAINNPVVKNDADKFRNYSTILKEENKKLNEHVERVLQMALLDKGETGLDKKNLNLKTLLENCITTHQLQIQSRKASVHLALADNLLLMPTNFT